MRNFFKNVDLSDVGDQIAELKGQVQDIRFRKPWTSGKSVSPIAWVGLGAIVAGAGYLLFKKRAAVAGLCSNCGASLKDKWEDSGMKDKTEDIIGKVKNGAKDSVDKVKTQAAYERNHTA